MKPTLAAWLGDLYGAAEHRIVAGWHWRKARTFDGLLATNIADLFRDRDEATADQSYDPAYWQEVSTEIALNRCGWFTTCSAVGGTDNSGHKFRAAVTGFADDNVKNWLTAITADTGYEVLAYAALTDHPDRAGQGLWDGPLWQATEGGRHAGCEYGDDCIAGVTANMSTIGRQRSAREILRTYPVPRAVRGALTRRWQVTVFDPEWGATDLFPFLLDAALDHQRQDAATTGKGTPS